MRLASNCLPFATIAVLLTLTSSAFSAETQPAKSPIGQITPDFTLSDFRGKEQSLSGIGKDKLVVVAFLGTECPLAKLYAPRLVALNKKFADQGVAFRQGRIRIVGDVSVVASLRPIMLRQSNATEDGFRE